MNIYVSHTPTDPSFDCDQMDVTTVRVVRVVQCKPSTVLAWVSVSARAKSHLSLHVELGMSAQKYSWFILSRKNYLGACG